MALLIGLAGLLLLAGLLGVATTPAQNAVRVMLATAIGGLGLTALPYGLPLDGPPAAHPSRLADANGAFVRVAGESLYYTHVSGPGEAVVLIHGFGGSTVTWEGVAPVLAEAGYDVYAVDLLGFGLSEKGWAYDASHPAQARRVLGLMDALGIDRAVIVGHSMGGNVAAHIALSAPERVSGLVLVSAAILGESNGMQIVPPALLELPPVRRWAQVALRALVVPMFDGLLFDAAALDVRIPAETVDGYRRALRTPEWDLGLLALTRDADRNGLPGPLSAIRAPTLIVWGAEDSWVAPQDGVYLEAQIPGAQRVEFAGVGHLPMHEVPQEFNAALLGFLETGR